MEGLAHAITALPPDKVDRQRLLECLGHGERNRVAGKSREASKWVMQAGAALHREGADTLPLAERYFQHAVHLAKQLDGDAPEFMQIEVEKNNGTLGDAYTWLGATEAALGKIAEAESHYKSAAKAVEDRGVVELSDKLLHQAIFFRNKKMREKYDAVLKRWEGAIRDARATGESREGDVALLQATQMFLNEKAAGTAKSGLPQAFARSIQLRAGALMKCAMRLEAHALRPLKQCVALHEVYESIAGAFDGAKMRNESNAFLKRSAAAFVASERFLGLTPIGELMLERDGVEAVAWSADLLREGGVGGGGGGGERDGGGRGGGAPASGGESSSSAAAAAAGEVETVSTPAVAAADAKKIFAAACTTPRQEQIAYEMLMKIGDAWKMRGAEQDEEEPFEGATEAGSHAFVVGQRIFSTEAWKDSQRPLRAAAAMLTGDAWKQGAACHYLGCAYFHERMQARDGGGAAGERLLDFAAGAFQAAVAARASFGPEDKRAAKEVAGSLLFLGRVLVEKKQFQNSERVTMQALDVSRKAFGDDGEMTKQCMSAMVGLRQRVQREKA
ncbi:uncharacterized protein MICPUCDRAFT_53435 [Micromonas pusilla CCMP1545]|uniref:Predicted protein n=1 Tax=Micromonas pusilla (strain CCMP1545) TaxID=564608 RepID=C1N6T6_MICPC|nr:uncharacterized protein MICPUCDRAFT_53435 [Micromonas pusilla CCMP1545]EEH52161.1 predicted protein [Micromonas pusilla CCMP1545]|eukprot:XP_003063788.1 predicted protein [Micromonas pusilla CCMP1545]